MRTLLKQATLEQKLVAKLALEIYAADILEYASNEEYSLEEIIEHGVVMPELECIIYPAS